MCVCDLSAVYDSPGQGTGNMGRLVESGDVKSGR